MKLNPLSRAFTLIEVLVALTLFSIVFLSMFEAYSYVLSIHTQLSRQRSLQETSRSTATFMAQKIETLGLDGDAMQSLTHSGYLVLRDKSYFGPLKVPDMYFSLDPQSDCLAAKKCCLGYSTGSTPFCISDPEMATLFSFRAQSFGVNSDKLTITQPFTAGVRLTIGYVSPNTVKQNPEYPKDFAHIPHLLLQTTHYDRIFQKK